MEVQEELKTVQIMLKKTNTPIIIIKTQEEQMNINIKTNKNFTTHLNKMKEKYGEEFEKLNGLHDKNLSYGDFIDGFIDEETVADATIDGNANAGSKDICSLEAEMDKPASKLLAFNKIFYEMNKKYGLQSARAWLETEWNGGFYLHDAPSSTFKPYSYFGKETLMIKYKDEQKFINFEFNRPRRNTIE